MTYIAYPASSPYYNTPQYAGRLGIFTPTTIAQDSTDISFTVTAKYNQNPMLLSQDVYNTPALWWVFSSLNINVLRDPIWDLNAGLVIRIPTLQRLNALGIKS